MLASAIYLQSFRHSPDCTGELRSSETSPVAKFNCTSTVWWFRFSKICGVFSAGLNNSENRARFVLGCHLSKMQITCASELLASV
jgi:hypothetical protein